MTRWACALAALVLCSCGGTRTAVGPDASDGGEADGEGSMDAEEDVSGDADADSPCLPDPDAEVDADPDVSPDAEEEDADSPVDADVEGETDAETDGAADADLEPCPSDMVPIGAACIDIYEASRRDGTAYSQGVDDTLALSRPGVIPWHVNPMTAEALALFEAACEAAGKRMCTPEEWERACCGAARPTCPSLASYVYGDTYDRELCNVVDTFCDDHCAAEGIDPCETGPDCGYRYLCFHAVPTGQMGSCTNGVGAFDINGNVWEILPVPTTVDARGYQVRGGAFNCANAAGRVNCEYNAGWTSLYAGFRCCMDR